MQYTLPLAYENRLLTAHTLLLAAFGPIPACHRLDPVSQMIFAMLSGRTRDAVAMDIFKALAARLKRWEDLAKMEPHVVKPLIATATFAEKKAFYLPAAIGEILTRRGHLDLGFLAEWPVVMAKAWLETLPGVGVKTSTAVLNFSTLHRRILMVDTAHNRVTRRLGLVPQKAGLARATRLLNRQLPDAWEAGDTETHHVLMQSLGRRFCTHRHPDCPNCPLCAMCPHACGEDHDNSRHALPLKPAANGVSP